jgi:hypothetical protein
LPASPFEPKTGKRTPSAAFGQWEAFAVEPTGKEAQKESLFAKMWKLWYHNRSKQMHTRRAAASLG